jgi:tripartite-type tricarboxylate transporter receptor subunit TctC
MMNATRARSFLAGLLCALSGAASAADAFPNRAMTLIVPYSEGGSSDTRARQIARHMSVHLGQPVQVVNHAGDGGNKGTDLIAKAKPDGYTFGLGNLAPMTVNRHLSPSLPFNPRTDLRAIGMIERGPLVLVVSADAEFATAQTLLDKAKAGPRRLRYASAGVGGSFHLAVELLEQQVGFFAQHVPFDGGGKATDALIQKQVDFKFDGMPSVVALLSEARPKVRALAVASRRRSPVLPGVPTFRELGIDGMEVSNWLGLVAPSGTPDVVIDRLNQALLYSLSQSDVGPVITRHGNDLGAGPPLHFDAFMSAESYRWGRLIREKKISP